MLMTLIISLRMMAYEVPYLCSLLSPLLSPPFECAYMRVEVEC